MCEVQCKQVLYATQVYGTGSIKDSDDVKFNCVSFSIILSCVNIEKRKKKAIHDSTANNDIKAHV